MTNDNSLAKFLQSAVTLMHAHAMSQDTEVAHCDADDLLVEVINRLAQELPADCEEERALIGAILLANRFAKWYA